jgi:YjbE family integral membrane protein
LGTLDFLQNASAVVIVYVVLLNLLLSADNAVAIALACRNLDARQQISGILWGSLGAMVLRLALVFVALSLLSVPGVKVIAALLLVWIGLRLLKPNGPERTKLASGVSLLAAIQTIVVADFLMSLDNVLAIAAAVSVGAAQAGLGAQLAMVAIGLAVTLPVLVFGSMALVKLFERLPWLVLVGVGLLGWIAGGLVISDVLVVDQLGAASGVVKLLVQAIGAIVVAVFARYWAGRQA